ncbi:MAG: DNA polymerase ligase N-terminal domain-containing protein, partial [Burkholderiaceae bacterium]
MATSPAGSLDTYARKRNFERTSEPPPTKAKRAAKGAAKALSFVIQKHWASHLHYDFRLELDGVLVSWAVPKGPSYDPAAKHMAIHVEDHPLSYGGFEGQIPKGSYGAGSVIVWDNGSWEPVVDPHEGLDKGKLIFKLHGQKLAGLWELVRISKPGQFKQDHWLLLKKRGDAWARPGATYDVLTALPDSVVAQPLGLAEDREPRGQTATAGRAPAAPDLAKAV